MRDSGLFRGHRREPGLLLAWVGLLPALRYDFGQMINLVMSNFGSCPPAVRADGFTSCPPHLTLGLLFQGSASRRAQSQCHRWLQGGFVYTFQKAGGKTAAPRPLQVARAGLFPFVVSHGELCGVEALVASPATVVLNLGITTPMGAKQLFHIGRLIEIYIIIHNSS